MPGREIDALRIVRAPEAAGAVDGSAVARINDERDRQAGKIKTLAVHTMRLRDSARQASERSPCWHKESAVAQLRHAVRVSQLAGSTAALCDALFTSVMSKNFSV